MNTTEEETLMHASVHGLACARGHLEFAKALPPPETGQLFSCLWALAHVGSEDTREWAYAEDDYARWADRLLADFRGVVEDAYMVELAHDAVSAYPFDEDGDDDPSYMDKYLETVRRGCDESESHLREYADACGPACHKCNPPEPPLHGMRSTRALLRRERETERRPPERRRNNRKGDA